MQVYSLETILNTISRRRYQRVLTSRDENNVRMKDKTYSEVVGEQFITAWQDMTKMKKPIIAAVNGYAVLTLHS